MSKDLGSEGASRGRGRKNGAPWWIPPVAWAARRLWTRVGARASDWASSGLGRRW